MPVASKGHALQLGTLTDMTDNMRLGKVGSEINLVKRYSYRHSQDQMSHLAGIWLAQLRNYLIDTCQSFVIRRSKAANQMHGCITFAANWLLSTEPHTPVSMLFFAYTRYKFLAQPAKASS